MQVIHFKKFCVPVALKGDKSLKMSSNSISEPESACNSSKFHSWGQTP